MTRFRTVSTVRCAPFPTVTVPGTLSTTRRPKVQGSIVGSYVLTAQRRQVDYKLVLLASNILPRLC
jgi:hypothetical protein